MSARPTAERFWRLVNRSGACWLWLGSATSQGRYGGFKVRGDDGKWRTKLAHRVAYELEVGPISAGLVIDHLCRNQHCVNPSHLEPVTIRENTLRGVGPTAINAHRTHCTNGHEFTEKNTEAADRLAELEADNQSALRILAHCSCALASIDALRPDCQTCGGGHAGWWVDAQGGEHITCPDCTDGKVSVAQMAATWRAVWDDTPVAGVVMQSARDLRSVRP